MHLIFSLFHLKNNFDICFLLDFVTIHEDVIANDEASTKLKSAVHSFLEKSFEKGDSIENSQTSEDLKIQTHNDSGEIISKRTETIRRPDGSSRTIKTIETIKKGDIVTETRIGDAKLMKIEEMVNIEDVDVNEASSFPVPNVLGNIK